MTGAHPAYLKLELAVRGLRLDPSVRQHPELFRADFLGDQVTRSLDLALSGDVRVAVAVEEPGASSSPFVLVADEGRFYLVRGGNGTAERLRAVRPVPQPRFYERRTNTGTPMWRVATVHGSHIVVNPGAACGFSLRGTPCRFCVEGARATDRETVASVADVVETVRAAFDEGAADLVYFNTGYFEGEDGGIAFLEPYIAAVRRHFDTLVATQVHPPRSDRWIDRTYAMGVDALSYNLEIFDPDVLSRHCIGRVRYIGRERYLDALAYAARIFPSGTVWSELVAGLEPPESTRAGIDTLVRAGVVPVVSIFHPLGETALRERLLPEPAAIVPVLEHLYLAVKRAHINMGWVRDLSLGITPLEARVFAGDGAMLAVAVQHMTRWRLGALAARSLARFRRRLRVKTVSESFDAAHT